MDPSQSLAVDHYSVGSLMPNILKALEDAELPLHHISSTDLHPVDQFHTGGIVATNELLSRMKRPKGDGCKVLDIGSGLGGTARHIALSWPESFVLGVDLTPEYVDAASQLTDLATDVDGSQCSFAVGSALDLPVGEEEFDAAVMLHVGMNVQDKKRLFAEASRVLKPGGQFGVFDVMLSADNNNGHPCSQDLLFPVPWASDNSHSFLGTLAEYMEAAEGAGFSIEHTRSRAQFAIDFFSPVKRKLVAAGALIPTCTTTSSDVTHGLRTIMINPPTSQATASDQQDRHVELSHIFPAFSTINTTFGRNGVLKAANLILMLESRIIEPYELVCTKPL